MVYGLNINHQKHLAAAMTHTAQQSSGFWSVNIISGLWQLTGNQKHDMKTIFKYKPIKDGMYDSTVFIHCIVLYVNH